MSERRNRLTALVAALALVPATAQAAERTYIVMLKDAPVASYKGGLKDRAYRGRLGDQQRAALGRAGGSAPDVLYSYRTAFAGFAARLTPAQRSNLARAPEVRKVFRNTKRHTESIASDNTALDAATGFGDTAAYLGLPAGLWSTLGTSQNAGDGVVVGVIDSGITPQHPSFSGAGYPAPPAGFTGKCDAEPGFCNNKLIAARAYVDGFGADKIAADSFRSPRDDDGHGTHTASTAAGDFGVNPSIKGSDLGVNQISGIAPRARVAAYKVCWIGNADTADGCTDADSIAAIDDAVADGVDVINYSVGGSGSTVIDPVMYAFLGASDAGVFVANSAGNDGPDPDTLGTPTTAPWLASVAADQPARTFTATATIDPPTGPDFDITGASVTPALGTATQVVDGNGTCTPGSLSGAVAGKVVLCLRGDNDRIEKSKVVQAAGGVGMILFNPDAAQDTVTDTHYVPSVHVSRADGLRVKAAIAAGTTTAKISKGVASKGADHVVAAFSSRGPQGAVPDLLKPDLAAPGVNILAGNTPDPAASTNLPKGELFQAISGTSMASPQVAGAAALLHQQHPTWTPAMTKSALMLTANPSLKQEDGRTPATPFDQGAGEIDPTAAGAAQLVLNETTDHYLAYLAAVDPAEFSATTPLAASDVNVASIANGAVAGSFSTSRTFTSTAATTKRWTVTADVPGFDVTAGSGTGAFPTFSVAPDKTATIFLSAQRTTAPLDRFAYGRMTLKTSDQELHVPITLRPVALAVADPIVATADASDGTFDIPAQVGYAGTLTAQGFGLTLPDVQPGQAVAASPSGEPNPAAVGPGNAVFDVSVPAGTQLLSKRLANVTPGSDLDLWAYFDANRDGAFTADELVGQSASAGSDEAVDLVQPAAGSYRFVVVGFTTADPTSTYDLATWTVDDTTPDADGFAITGDPILVRIGDAVTPIGEYTGLDAAGLYLGVGTFANAGGQVAARVIELTKAVDTTVPPTEDPTEEPTPSATSPRPKLKVLGAKLIRQRILRLRVSLNRRARVDPNVTRLGRAVAGAKSKVVKKGRHTIRFKLSRRLRRGQTYRVTLKLRAHGKTGNASFRIKVTRRRKAA